jgi:hypothetical protein
MISTLGIVMLGMFMGGFATQAKGETIPKPPLPEPIAVTELPLPPVGPSKAGACTAAVNPHRTGCIDPDYMSFQAGSFLPDGHHVLALVHFVGAPPAPDPSSIYAGGQIILVKTDGSVFSNGDPWKCVTCGVGANNAVGISRDQSYPQSFVDGRRILEGTNIVDCSPFQLTDDRCNADAVHIYPIRWENKEDGSGPGGRMRELRLHPDNIHLGFNGMSFEGGQISQYGYFARLEFNPSPKTGEPLAPRYDLVHVTRLARNGHLEQVVEPVPSHRTELRIDFQTISVGEFRGFTKDGREAFYVGYPFESCNLDIFAVDLASGKVRRITADPEYADPIDASPDDKWIVVEDTRGSDRQMFMSAMRGVPPITDMISTGAVASVRNNHDRRFFQPFLLDRWGDRGNYSGQRLNPGDGAPGSTSDPNWNALADPRWSPDGTAIAFYQGLVTSPACGGTNPLPCPASTEPGGRRMRLLLAHLTSRKPLTVKPLAPVRDDIPWGSPYVPGSPAPMLPIIAEGKYTLRGLKSGLATVVITQTADRKHVQKVEVRYEKYSDDGLSFLSGSESVAGGHLSPTVVSLDWRSNITQSGKVNGTKVTGPDGFKLSIDVMRNILQTEGTLTTTINGKAYRQPGNGD